MPRVLREQLRKWAEGVNTTLEADLLPAEASPRGHNSALTSAAEGNCVVGNRKGCTLVNTTPITSSPVVLGQAELRRMSGGVVTSTHVLVSDGGRCDKIATDGTLTAIDASGFTAGTYYPDFAAANNLLFIVNGQDRKKYNGTALQNFGITAPVAPTNGGGSGGSMTAGTYDIAVTYYNSATGHESSRSDFTAATIGAGGTLPISWTASSDSQVDFVRIYIRKQSTMTKAFLVTTGISPAVNGTALGIAVGTTSATIDITDAQLSALTTVAPTTTENNRPPSGVKFVAWHRGRMFVADTSNLYYSQQDKPEAFDPLNYEPVNANDSDEITGLKVAFDRLYIFKRRSVYALVGTDPTNWVLELVAPTLGAVSHRTIMNFEHGLAWWDMIVGPVVYTGEGLPVPVGRTYLAADISPATLAYSQLSAACGINDLANQRLLFAVPELGQLRNTRIIPFNYRLRRFDADVWNPIDVASMAVVYGSSVEPIVYVGSYSGTVFQWWDGYNDGVQSGTSSGTVTSSTATTLTDSSASFVTSGAKLVDRYVYVINADGTSVQRRRITGNTGTVLTVATDWSTNPNTAYTYVVGGIDFQWDTPWMVGGDLFTVKRFEWFYLQAASAAATTATVYVDFFRNWDISSVIRTLTLNVANVGALYDALTSLYDTSLFGSFGKISARRRPGFVGQAWRARIRSLAVDQDVTLYGLQMESTKLTSRLT